MTPQAIAGIANIGLSALPLFFGENSIFSRKARDANKELEKNFRASQAMQLPGEYDEAMQNLRTQANVGIPGAALGLYQQQAGRQQASQLAALGSRRSALGGVGQIAQAGQDASLRLAGMQSQALQQGQSALRSGLMQMGGLKQQDALRKQQEAADYWGTRKAESNAAVSSALSSIGQAAGSALALGAFDGLGGGASKMTAGDLGRQQISGLLSGMTGRQAAPQLPKFQGVAKSPFGKSNPLSYFNTNFGNPLQSYFGKRD
jgi:hypothetical protein